MKEHEEKVIAELERMPALKVFREKEAAEILSKRQVAAARIEDLRLDLEATGILQREIDDMAGRLAGLEKERNGLLQEIGNQKSRYYGEKMAIEAAIRRQRGILLESCATAIDEAIKFLQDHREYLLKKAINTQERHGKIDIKTEKMEITVFSNSGAIRAALAYCLNGIRELEEIKLSPMPDLGRIEALKKNIPDADELMENITEKDMGRDDPGPGLLAAMRRATDNLIDFDVKTLLEKTQKLLAPKRAGARR